MKKVIGYATLYSLLVLCLSAAVLAQATKAKPGPVVKPGVIPGKSVAIAGDSVEVSDFSIEPAQPKPGDTVTVKMTIKNNGNAKLEKVAWQIAKNADKLGEGEQENVDAGATFEVTANWTAAEGEHHFYGDVDPNGAITEPRDAKKNNTKAANITIGKNFSKTDTQSSTQQQFETQILDYQKAKEAGAQFAHNVESSMAGCSVVGQFNPAGYSDGADKSVVFHISCDTLGNKASPEAFKNFTLKNGWKIKSTDVKEWYNDTWRHAEWQWVTRPVNGSDNPYMKMRLVANAASLVTVSVKVMIEGPAGTNPYQ